MINPALGRIDRPETALTLETVKVGDKIVSYSPNRVEKREVEILSIDNIVDHEDEIVLITYQQVFTCQASDLGLTPNPSDGKWHRYAIPFDENE